MDGQRTIDVCQLQLFGDEHRSIYYLPYYKYQMKDQSRGDSMNMNSQDDVAADNPSGEGDSLQTPKIIDSKDAKAHFIRNASVDSQQQDEPNLKFGQNEGADQYSGLSISQTMAAVSDRERRQALANSQNNDMKQGNAYEDQYNKKQMEFKGGKLHQLISDQNNNRNAVAANRYQHILGLWYLLNDTFLHFENILAILLFFLIMYTQEYNQISISFPVVALSINVVLMFFKNLTLELRQRAVSNKINRKVVDQMLITRKVKRFFPIIWSDVKVGHILRVKSGQEFPADCLILDIQGPAGQKCFVTSGPFDDSTGIIQKKSFNGTSNKMQANVGTNTAKQKNTEAHLAEMLSGFLKFEYNYFGYIRGSLKLNENPAANEFDHDNVVQRGALLTQTPQVICLVLNVGDQCMGNVYVNPKDAQSNVANKRLLTMVKAQRTFDKAYKYSIRIFLMSLALLYLMFTGLAIYLASNDRFFTVYSFEQYIISEEEINTVNAIKKGTGFFAILLSSIPISFSNIIDLLVLCHTNFAEWDINIAPAAIEFLQPHATLAFGKVAHMFFSRTALQKDDQQCVKVFHVGSHFFLNQVKREDWEDARGQQESRNSFSNGEVRDARDRSGGNIDNTSQMIDQEFDENSLDYLPNELKLNSRFYNEEAEAIYSGPNSNPAKQMILEFFRGITLCHQANVVNDKRGEDMQRYICVLHDEVASLEFAQQQDFRFMKRSSKMMTLKLQGRLEKYEELGVVTTKAVLGHFMTVAAVRLQGRQAGVLYMKGSIASLKHYFIEKEQDFQYLNVFEQKFIQAGVQAIVYAKRQLTIEETNQLIITINEGIQSTRENVKLDQLLYNLTSTQLDILGVLGVQRPIHLRNRVAVDDMIQNGVKPWIVSKEDEQTHLTSLNSFRLFQNCAAPLVVNGQRERIVQDQIQHALKVIIDRIHRNQSSNMDKNMMDDYSVSETGDRKSQGGKDKEQRDKMRHEHMSEKNIQNLTPQQLYQLQKKRDARETQRNVVVFTGRALVEILRDQTMQKSFMTLAYISDMMVGSEVSPLQKQQLLKIAKSYVGEGEYAAAIVATCEDQFMANEADLVANFKTKGKSADFQAVSDVTFKDFSAISYLLFKHGNQIQMRLSKAAQAFFYRSLVTFLILATFMIRSGFSGAIPYTNFYYFFFMLFLAPAEILIYAIYYKDYAYDYLYRIFGHYKYNFSFSLVEVEFLLIDMACAIVDWLFVYLPFETVSYGAMVSVIDGKNVGVEAHQCYQVILLQMIFFFYFIKVNVQVIYATNTILVMSVIGAAMIFDDEGLIGTTQLFTCPAMLFALLFQLLVLVLRNTVAEVASKLLMRRYADLLDWYQDVEDRLQFEEYEDPTQTFSIAQYQPLNHKIKSSTIQNTLRLINTNMMKCPKTDGIEQILEKINTVLDIDMRGSQQQVVMTGTIGRWTLELNDLNKETEYQDNKNIREIVYVQRQMVVFIITTLLFGLFGLTLSITIQYTNIGIYYYVALSLFSLIVYVVLPAVINYLSNILLFYTAIVIFCYTIYTSESESLQPTGLVFVLALVAGLNHSYIYITMIMIVVSVMMNIFFSFLTDTDQQQLTSYFSTFSTTIRIFTGLVWSAYVYIQELEKKKQFVNCHRKVRSYLKLKQILNILVPAVVRDKIKQGKKNYTDDECEVTIIQVEIDEFDSIVRAYSATDLIQQLDGVFNVFDQLCDQYGLLKVEAVGRTFMACGGLKSVEKKIDQRLLNRHHSVRVADFAIELQNYVKGAVLKGGRQFEASVGIHTGLVIASVLGETKPHFSLIGDAVTKTQALAAQCPPRQIACTKQTNHYLELYTTNFWFAPGTCDILCDGNEEQIFYVSTSRKKIISEVSQQAAGAPAGAGPGPVNPLLIGKVANGPDGMPIAGVPAPQYQDGKQETQTTGAKNLNNMKNLNLNESESNGTDSEGQREELGRGFDVEQEITYQNREIQGYDNRNEADNESNRSDQIDDQTMNVFGFNDDLNLDDRIIIQNQTENQLYNLVERPRYLLSFELREAEQEFLYTISKQEAHKTTSYLAQMILLNKIVIFGDMFQEKFTPTYQFFLMFPIFIYEIVLIYKLNNPTLEYIYFWTYALHLYGIMVLGILLSYQAKYLGQWTIAAFNELQVQLTISLIFMMRNVLLRHYLLTYTVYMVTWIATVFVVAKEMEYQILQFLLGQIMYSILLAVGIHHREMIQRKLLNYERVLNVQIDQTNALIGKLVPYHILTVIKNEKRQMVDEFSDCTLLYTDMCNLTQYQKYKREPREVVALLGKIFARFDQLCEEHRVYKVHTIGDTYVVMGYNGRVDKSKRARAVVVDEANRVVQCGFEMLQLIEDLREAAMKGRDVREVLEPGAPIEVGRAADLDLLAKAREIKDLQMRIGVHTGKVIAGVVGSKLVRYDIFGEGVITAQRVCRKGEPGKVCVSAETMKTLQSLPEVGSDFSFEPLGEFKVNCYNGNVQTFVVTRRLAGSFSLSEGQEHSSYGRQNDSDDDQDDADDSDSEIGTTRQLVSKKEEEAPVVGRNSPKSPHPILNERPRSRGSLPLIQAIGSADAQQRAQTTGKEIKTEKERDTAAN